MEWLSSGDITNLVEKAKEYEKLSEEYKSILEDISLDYKPSFFSLQAAQVEYELVELMKKVMEAINNYNFKDEGEILASIPTTVEELMSNKHRITNALQLSSDISGKLGLGVVETFDSILELHKLLRLILSEPRPTREWFNAEQFSIASDLVEEAHEKNNKLVSEITDLTNVYDKDILRIDFHNILRRFKTDYTSFLKFFKMQYRRDKKLIKSYSKEIGKKVSDEEVIGLLNKIKGIVELDNWFDDKKELLSKYLGSHFIGKNTQWSLLKKSLENFRLIRDYFPGKLISVQLEHYLLNQGTDHEIRIIYNSLSEFINNKVPEALGTKLKQEFLQVNSDLVNLIEEVSNTCDKLIRIKSLYDSLESYDNNNVTYQENMDNLKKLARLQSIEKVVKENQEQLECDFHHYFNGLNTDWDETLKSIKWTGQFKDVMEFYDIPHAFGSKICTDDDDLILKAKSSLEELQKRVSNMNEDWEWYVGIFSDQNELLDMSLDYLVDRMYKCLNGISSLEEWIDYRNSREDCKKEGLTDYVSKIEELNLEDNLIVDSFLKRFYRLWLDAMIPNYPAISSFRRRKHEEIIAAFRELDEMQLSIASNRVKEKLLSLLPDTNVFTSAYDEVGVLRRELGKQRRIMPLRKLFNSIPNLLPRLKPCLMMSPLSVSMFLESQGYNFDVIIFDEASQVCTEDAVGAIMRGKQVIIAGDNKQLPPTNFFSTTSYEGDFDTEDEEVVDESEGFESILDEAVTFLPERTLKWHYRSRHENLIAFSNHKIYRNNLITFPSHFEKDLDVGVEYIHVADGVYDRGGRKTNHKEAIKVGELVFEMIKKHPNRSLGIVTFSSAQQQEIETVIRKMRIENQQYEYFFSEEKEESFFIKNLENVQGDERDTIIFSIGYAKDANGTMSMNFGPLTRTGGERRLNVAITRAKFNVKLVGSINPTDIRIESISSEGPKLLRSYIEFAMKGPEIFNKELTISEHYSPDSPFEESVYDFLVSKGYNVSTQVGCSGYRIDLAVKHPTLSGRFVLGVECDGATYHSSRTARERDRLRQTVLEDIGWKIYRIWSTDWIKDPVKEGSRLLEVVQRAINEYAEEESVTVKDMCTSHPKVMGGSNNIVKVDIIDDNQQDELNPYEFDFYEEASIYDLERTWDTEAYIKNVLQYIVDKEQPIHFDLICRRVAGLFGNQKVTSKVKDSTRYVLDKKLNKIIGKQEDFYSYKNLDNIIPRVPEQYGEVRPIEYISRDEISEAMVKITSKSFGLTAEQLCFTTAKVFGFNRRGKKINSIMQECCDELIYSGKLKESGGKIICN